MRLTPRLLASALSTKTTTGPLSTPGPMALLPPIPLYRRLLRAHRKYLPAEMRLLGDEYVKAEFRAHRDVENPVHLVFSIFLPFLSQVFFSVSPMFFFFSLAQDAERTGQRSGPKQRQRQKLTDTKTLDRLPHRVAAVRAKD